MNAISPEARPNGRRAQAARNDVRILDAARAVFVADPGAPISAVAAKAGVGISALYNRYPSKEALLRRLCADTVADYLAIVEAALADDGDAWTAFAEFMGRVVDEDASTLTLRLAGTFTPDDELHSRAKRARDLTLELFERTTATGILRSGLVVDDLWLLFEQIASVRVADERRTRELHQRYLALFLDALRTPSATPLPGPAPSWPEIDQRWRT